MGRARKQADDVGRAREDIDTYSEKLEDIENELAEEIEEIEEKFDVDSLELDELLLKPRKSDIDIRHMALAWVPFSRDAAGGRVPLYE